MFAGNAVCYADRQVLQATDAFAAVSILRDSMRLQGRVGFVGAACISWIAENGSLTQAQLEALLAPITNGPGMERVPAVCARCEMRTACTEEVSE